MIAASQHHFVDGVERPALIKIDRWGAPHIEAETIGDLFFAQGFNAARDRLWQIDLWRKRGLGLLAADFGPGYLEQDRAARLFLYRGDMDAEWAAYGPDARQICQSFAAGVNAYIAEIEAGRAAAPPEFAQLATAPSRWSADDIVRIRSHGLSRNAPSEILRAILRAAAPCADDLRVKLTPGIEPEYFPDAILADIPADTARALLLAAAPVTFSAERLSCSLHDAALWASAADIAARASAEGSNNWAVAGSRTRHGRPILANDPHRVLSLPSLRYLVHLKGAGFNVIGAGDPHAPGLCIGHNETIAFGLTIFKADQEDVHVYETDPSRSTSYRFAEGWEEFSTIEETITVKGHPEQPLTMRFTRHGPVIFADPDHNRCFALRSVWFEPGAAPYLASLGYLRARNLAEFTSALDGWGAPSVNQVYADVNGVIARMPCGRAPVRNGWSGLIPTPADGRFEWSGWRPLHRLAAVTAPECGYVLSANEMNLPDDWDHSTAPVGFEWDESSRAARITEALSTSAPHDVAESCALQVDVESPAARRALAVVARLQPSDPDAKAARDSLVAWTGAMAGDSGPAALFQLWWRGRLKPAMIEKLVAPSLRIHVGPGHDDAILDRLENPEPFFAEAELQIFLCETLAAAYRDANRILGDDVASWRWDRLHYALFAHPLASVRAGGGKDPWRIGPFPLGGDAATVMYFDSDSAGRVVAGASVRIVMDVGDWDRSLWINAPGQSGDPSSPHYGDLAPLWARGEYVPMLYSDAAVAAHLESTIELIPTAKR